MKKLSILALAAIVLAITAASCNNDSEIGESIVQNQIEIKVDSSFTVTGHSVSIEKVQSRTTAQLIGRIDAKGFGKMSSDVVTQFMPSSVLDTTGVTVEDVDSLLLYFYVASNEFVGDSVAPLGLDIYRLDKLLPSPIYSDFNPEDYYNKDALLTRMMYNATISSADTLFSGGMRMKVTLPRSLGRELYSAYVNNPASFATPTSFAENVFKGLYLKNSYGSGRVMRISATQMSLFYHQHLTTDAGTDSIVCKSGDYFAVTPEIISNNNITLSLSQSLDQMVADGEQIIAAPVGLKVQMEFPAQDVIDAFRKSGNDVSILNSVTFSLPAETIENDCDIVPPTYLLLVLSKEEDAFFAENKLPDSETSFYATYDKTTKTYNFGQMRNYVIDLLDKASLSAEDYTFSLVPVSCVFESNSSSSSYYYYYYQTTSTLTTMMPYMASPVMARLLLDQAKIKLTYSSQSLVK